VSDTQTLEDLLREWDAQTGGPRYEPLPLPVRPETGHAQRSNGKLQFSTPPIVQELSFGERMEPLLAPLRERVEAAETHFYERQLILEEQHRAKMAEAEAALARRHDIELAHASLRNVSQQPLPAFHLPPPDVMANMSQREWEQFVADYRSNRK
jgi:hypothetical protein